MGLLPRRSVLPSPAKPGSEPPSPESPTLRGGEANQPLHFLPQTPLGHQKSSLGTVASPLGWVIPGCPGTGSDQHQLR